MQINATSLNRIKKISKKNSPEEKIAKNHSIPLLKSNNSLLQAVVPHA
jgi:hypothetical protein